MSSEQKFVDFITDQIEHIGVITTRKMFGEYGIYCDGKIFGLICDNKLFIKPTEAGRRFIGDFLIEAPPYPGAKHYFLIEEKIEDRDWLGELIFVTWEELLFPQPKKMRR